MKTKLINLRVDPVEYERYAKAARSQGKTLSAVCRDAMERLAKRADKSAAVKDTTDG